MHRHDYYGYWLLHRNTTVIFVNIYTDAGIFHKMSQTQHTLRMRITTNDTDDRPNMGDSKI